MDLSDDSVLGRCDLRELLIGLHIGYFLKLLHLLSLHDVQLLDGALLNLLAQVRQRELHSGKSTKRVRAQKPEGLG